MILILADEFDAHADAVQLNLQKRDQKFFRFNLNIEALLKTEISFDGNFWYIEQAGNLISSEVSIIWARRLTVQQTLEQQNEVETPSSRIWKGEWNIPNTPHEELTPPEEISFKVQKLMQKLGLRYGALDFIVDKEGQWWYLEVNSAGQWLWIEDLVGFPISASIADALIRGGGQQA